MSKLFLCVCRERSYSQHFAIGEDLLSIFKEVQEKADNDNGDNVKIEDVEFFEIKPLTVQIKIDIIERD